MIFALFLAFIDVIKFSLITYALLDRKFEFSFATKWATRRMIRTYGAALITTILIGLSFYIGGGQVHRVISIVLLPVFIKIIARIAWRFAIAIYTVIFLLLMIIQIPIIPIFLLSGLGLDQQLTFILGQFVSLTAVTFIYFKIKLYKILWFLEKYAKLKLMLFVVTGGVSIILFLINYEESLLYWLYYSFVVGMLLLSTTQVILGIGELRTDLLKTSIGMAEESDAKAMYQKYTELAKQYDVDIDAFPEKEVQKKIIVDHPRIVIKHQSGTDSVYTDNIMYIELYNRKTKIMLENGQELLTSKTIGFWKKQLTSKNFGHPSQSYVVNFQHMDCITPEGREITMDNGKNFIIPVRKVKETDDAFRNYLDSED